MRTKTRARFLLVPLTILALVAGFLQAPAMPAQAALTPGGAVGPINPISGFPNWYMDQNGLKLDLMEAADNFGISAPVVVGNAFSEAIGFGAEGFWWSADASIDNGAQTGLLVLALEAAFSGGEIPTNGEQSAFGRIRVRVDGLTPGASYTINHPFGTLNEVADGAGVVNVTSDIGGFGVPGFPANFNIPLTSGIGPFLTWNTFPNDPVLINPARPTRRYVGNPTIAHAVTGGTNGNAFSIVGGAGDLTGINATQTLFTVTGRVTQTALTQVTPVPLFTTDTTPDYTFSSIDAGNLTFGGDCSSATTTAVSGNNTITFNALALGAHSNCTITLTTAGGTTDTLSVPSFTISTFLPDTIGVRRDNKFLLRNTNNSGAANVTVAFGRSTDTPLIGDWDGNGTKTVGVKRGNAYFLSNSNTTPNVGVVSFSFGRATDTAIVGDWDGNGTDTIGLQRGNSYFLSNSNTTPNVGVVSIASFGRATDTAIAGDWDGDNTDTIGIKRGNAYFFADSNITPAVGVTTMNFGRATDTAIAGDFDGDGIDTVGLRRGNTTFLSNSTTTPNTGISSFTFGRATDMPVVGLWDLVF